MKIGITGHQRLRDPSDWEWVENAMLKLVKSASRPLIGISSVAIGADQLFAQIILQNGGTLEAVIPFDDYERTFADNRDRDEYRSILSRASQIEVLAKTGLDEENYLKAGKRVVDLSDLLIAVWDGKPAAGLGGTGDVVEYALMSKKRVFHLNPTSRMAESLDEEL